MLYHHYMLAFLVGLELIAGIKLWVKVLNGGHNQTFG
jgi:hypothetical protein